MPPPSIHADEEITSCDVYQTMGRDPTSKGDLLPTILPGSKMWILGTPAGEHEPRFEPRFLTGSEALDVSCFPVNFIPSGTTNSMKVNLAGNAMPGGIAGAMQIATLVRYPKFPSKDNCDDLQDRLDLIGELAGMSDSSVGRHERQLLDYIFVARMRRAAV